MSSWSQKMTMEILFLYPQFLFLAKIEINMKKRNLLYLLVAILLPLTSTFMISSSAGRLGNSTTSCGGGGCHAANMTTTSLTITGLPSTGYVPGTTYNLTATVSNSAYTMAAARGGFNISCTQGKFNASTGVTVNPGDDQEITHDGAKAMSSGSVSWPISWTAPTSPSSNFTNFNFAGNATNGNFTTSGDQPNQDILSFNQATSTVGNPIVTNVTATNIMATGCTVSADVNANGASTTVDVEYGTTMAYGSTQATTPTPVTGTSVTAVVGVLSGLLPSTMYNYRITATNSTGTTNSPNGTFTTGPSSVPAFAKSQFSVFPNPTTNMLNVRLEQTIQSFKVDLFNLNGQLVSSPQVLATDKELQLNLDDMASGVYFLHAVINEKLILQKITIQ